MTSPPPRMCAFEVGASIVYRGNPIATMSCIVRDGDRGEVIGVEGGGGLRQRSSSCALPYARPAHAPPPLPGVGASSRRQNRSECRRRRPRPAEPHAGLTRLQLDIWAVDLQIGEELFPLPGRLQRGQSVRYWGSMHEPLLPLNQIGSVLG